MVCSNEEILCIHLFAAFEIFSKIFILKISVIFSKYHIKKNNSTEIY